MCELCVLSKNFTIYTIEMYRKISIWCFIQNFSHTHINTNTHTHTHTHYLRQTIPIHPCDDNRCIPPHGEAKPFRGCAEEGEGGRGRPLVLGREDGNRTQQAEHVLYAMLGEVWGSEGQLELGGSCGGKESVLRVCFGVFWGYFVGVWVCFGYVWVFLGVFWVFLGV